MDRRVQIAITLMKEDLRREVSLNDLACSVGLSRSRFQHLFKSETRTTPARYLRQLRIARAKGLLETSLLSVKQIQASVGIKDKRHFTQDFKKAYGLTPTKYRLALSTLQLNKREQP